MSSRKVKHAASDVLRRVIEIPTDPVAGSIATDIADISGDLLSESKEKVSATYGASIDIEFTGAQVIHLARSMAEMAQPMGVLAFDYFRTLMRPWFLKTQKKGSDVGMHSVNLDSARDLVAVGVAVSRTIADSQVGKAFADLLGSVVLSAACGSVSLRLNMGDITTIHDDKFVVSIAIL